MKPTLMTGFIHDGLFYSREPTAELAVDPAQAIKDDKKSSTANPLEMSSADSQPLAVKFLWFIGLYTGSLLSFKLLISSVRWALMLATGYGSGYGS